MKSVFLNLIVFSHGAGKSDERARAHVLNVRGLDSLSSSTFTPSKTLQQLGLEWRLSTAGYGSKLKPKKQAILYY